jgi:hypothetical protein
MKLGLQFLSFNHSCDLANVENIDAVSFFLFCKDGIQLELVIKRERETESSATCRDAGEATSEKRGREIENLRPTSAEPRSILVISRTKRGKKRGERG